MPADAGKREYCVQAVEYRGPPSEEEDPQYVLETSAAPGSLKAGLPKLPTGTLVQGLPAAIMSHCQVLRK